MAVTDTFSAPRPSCSSSMTTSNSPDTNGRWSAKKENQFILQHGSKLHAYSRDKSPYPISYDRESLELWAMDHALVLRAKGSISFIDFKGKTPKRCLDVGCGLGDWIIDAAKHWTDCTFVGYDLVNIQIPLGFLDKSIASRVQWAHGNILRQRLPFDDDEFDHVHVKGMAFSVPENKWPSFFEEINRVLKPGGTIEMLEEDAIFPVLPRWFTNPLRAQTKRPSALFPDGTIRSLLPPPSTSDDQAVHDHALLESLFRSVFDNRFINPTPSAILPSYFSSSFRHVSSPPVLVFSMPPLAPLLPLPDFQPLTPDSDCSDTSSMLSPDENFASSHSTLPTDISIIDYGVGAGDSPVKLSDSLPSVSHPRDRTFSISTNGSTETDSSTDSVTLNDDPHLSNSSFQRRSVASYATSDLSTSIGSNSVLQLFPMDELQAFDEHSRYMQLYRAVGLVLSVKEAMWGELKERIQKEKASLIAMGWGDDEFLEDIARQKFEALVDRYRGDMHVRIALWHSLVKCGWSYPLRDPLSKAEVIEEERLRRAITEAKKRATEEELMIPTRSLRLLVGMKDDIC